MNIDKKDHLVILYEKKRLLVEVIGNNGKNYVGVVCDESRASAETKVEVKFSKESVLGNFGKHPPENMAFGGVKLQPWRQSYDLDPWGTIHFFRELEDNEERVLRGALKKVGREIVELGLDAHLPIDIHIRPPQGKWAGSYLARNGESTKRDVMTFHPASLKDRVEAEYVVWHEDGHRIWYRFLPAKVMATWIKLYHETIQLGLYELTDIEAMREDFVTSKLSIKDFRSELDSEDEVFLFNDVLAWITGWNGISLKNLEVLALADPDHVSAMWPTRQLDMMDKTLLISDYAKTSAEEFFAEAWAFFFTKKDIPDNVTKMVEKTLRHIQKAQD